MLKTILIILSLALISLTTQAQDETKHLSITISGVRDGRVTTKSISITTVERTGDLVKIKGYDHFENQSSAIAFKKESSGWKLVSGGVGTASELFVALGNTLTGVSITSIRGTKVSVSDLSVGKDGTYFPNLMRCDCLSNDFVEYFLK